VPKRVILTHKNPILSLQWYKLNFFYFDYQQDIKLSYLLKKNILKSFIVQNFTFISYFYV